MKMARAAPLTALAIALTSCGASAAAHRTLNYWRRWESAPPERSFEATIVVRRS